MLEMCGFATTAGQRELKEHYRRLGDLRNDFRNRALFQWIGERVGAGPILDFGCGSGGLVRFLAERGKTVIGLEPDAALAGLARERNRDLQIIEGGAERLEELPARVACVTLVDVLEHIPEEGGLLRRLAGTLLPGGLLIAVAPAHPSLYGPRDRAIGHYRRYTRNGLAGKLEECGYRVREIRYWNMLGVLPYGICQRILRRTSSCGWREESGRGVWTGAMAKGLLFWYTRIENRWNAGFGLSLLCVASRSDDIMGPSIDAQ